MKSGNRLRLLCVLTGILATLAGAAAAQGAPKEGDADDDLLLPRRSAPNADDDLLLPRGGAAKDDGLLLPRGGEAKTEVPRPLQGFLQLELARTVADPEHWSKAKARLELGTQGRLSDAVKWKVSGRFDYDAVFDIEKGFYPSAVRDDQKHEFQWRETYLDIAAGDWEWRLGRQHIVWGEMVGLFFADVVSAKDLREFILPDFDLLRIPQWAARAEYFKDDFHAELVWIPYPSFDNIGKPCGEFYAFPPVPALGGAPQVPCIDGELAPGLVVLGEERPKRKLSNGNYGLRLSTLRGGWDVSAFFYRSFDSTPSFHRQIDPLTPAIILQPIHNRITQGGATVAKDLGSVVLKAEAIVTNGRNYSVTRLSEPDGLVRLNTLDYVIGLDYTLPADTRLNVQYFQRLFSNHDPDIIPERQESGFTALLSHEFPGNLEVQGLYIRSLNRPDWLFRPKLTWGFDKNWRWVLGADVFGGPATGLFGQFSNRDRLYTEVRYSF